MRKPIVLLMLILCSITFGQHIKIPQAIYLGINVNTKSEVNPSISHYQTQGINVSISTPIINFLGIEISNDFAQHSDLNLNHYNIKKITTLNLPDVHFINIKTKIYSPTLYVITQLKSFNKQTFNPYFGLGIGRYKVKIPEFTYYNGAFTFPTISESSTTYRSKLGLSVKLQKRVLVHTEVEIIHLNKKILFIDDQNLWALNMGIIFKFGKY